MHALRTFLVGLLTVSLTVAPVVAAPSRSLGVVIQAERARLGAGPAIEGATIFNGDTLATDATGNVRVRLGSAQLYLKANSTALLLDTPDGVRAELRSGTAVFSSAGEGPIELRASEARIRPRTSLPTLAQVTLVGPYELLLTCQRGELEVTIGDEIHAVPEGTSYRVFIEPEVPNPQGGPPKKAARSRFLLITLIAIGAGAGVGIGLALMSPDRP
jgi:hypothetical protein